MLKNIKEENFELAFGIILTLVVVSIFLVEFTLAKNYPVKRESELLDFEEEF